MKRLKYCRNYELPLFDQEQCYQFVIIDLRQLNFLLIAIYIWINVASKIAGFTTTATIFINSYIWDLNNKCRPSQFVCTRGWNNVDSKMFFLSSFWSNPGCPPRLALTRDAQSSPAWERPSVMSQPAPGPRNKVTRCQCVIIFNNYPDITRGSAR